MGKDRYETGKAPVINIRCKRDLRVRGWTESAMLINGQSYTTEENEKEYLIDSESDLSIMVPVASVVRIETSAADLAIKNLEGDLAIGDVGGDASLLNLASVSANKISGDMYVKNLNGSFRAGDISGDCVLRNVFDVKLGTVNGDCAARNVNGAMEVQAVMGDFSLRTINGDVTIDKGHRDVNLRNIGGVVTSLAIRGDVRLRGGLALGKHRISADGDIVILWPPEIPVVVEANASQIKNKLPLVDIAEGDNNLSGRIGEDGAVLILNAKGRIILKELSTAKDPWDQTANGDYTVDLGFDLADLGEQISDEINAHMTAWSLRMENEFGPKFTAKIEKKAQEVAAKAERAATRAVRRAEKASSQARWGAGPNVDRSKTAQNTTGKQEQKATQEEQLKILRMVEKGIISPDEAGTLLDALEN
ncbi:MAG: hypothetical protein WA996_03905 [Candidatus Promineifilaceae bacterium]